MPEPLVSVVIPAWNSSKTIRACLESLRNQTYGNVEIIIVDNHSVDDTQRIVRSFGLALLVAGPERSSQVNLGVRRANGKYVYRVDSDFVVDASVIRECVEKCAKFALDAVAFHN